ncbi:MAG: hypothetical protein GY820_13165 [Gammaproteobacteria bacterium]|nr:hypothetical protein [Gammaproteobacteria bacterium]
MMGGEADIRPEAGTSPAIGPESPVGFRGCPREAGRPKAPSLSERLAPRPLRQDRGVSEARSLRTRSDRARVPGSGNRTSTLPKGGS